MERSKSSSASFEATKYTEIPVCLKLRNYSAIQFLTSEFILLILPGLKPKLERQALLTMPCLLQLVVSAVRNLFRKLRTVDSLPSTEHAVAEYSRFEDFTNII